MYVLLLCSNTFWLIKTFINHFLYVPNAIWFLHDVLQVPVPLGSGLSAGAKERSCGHGPVGAGTKKLSWYLGSAGPGQIKQVPWPRWGQSQRIKSGPKMYETIFVAPSSIKFSWFSSSFSNQKTLNLFISQNPFEHKYNTYVLGEHERILERSIWNVFLRLQFIKISFVGQIKNILWTIFLDGKISCNHQFSSITQNVGAFCL